MDEQFAYTGTTPERGYVGYVNLATTEGGLRFTVRSEGESAPTGVYEVPAEEAVKLLQQALAALCP